MNLSIFLAFTLLGFGKLYVLCLPNVNYVFPSYKPKRFNSQVLNNGLLVDPHDQKAIADALLKLVAEKNLWAECRKMASETYTAFHGQNTAVTTSHKLSIAGIATPLAVLRS